MTTKIAIVEDDRGIRNVLEQVINDAPGHRCVCTCDCGEDALRQLPKSGADVVLMDINLPDLSGIDCTHQLQTLMPGVPVIMLTVYADTELIFKALQAGAKGYLLKRTGSNEIIKAIHDVLQGGAPMTGEIARKVIESFAGASANQKSDAGLSRREEEILNHLSQGYSNKEIASKLNISFDTVRTHLRRIYEKLHVHGRAGAVASYLKSK
jgi:DNA-binding NarL/FixJ family response regulator